MFAELFAVAALATAPAVQEAATAEQIATARAMADRIAAAADATDLFENVTDDSLPRLRHRKSGMVCVFDPSAPRNNVQIYPASALTPNRGDDVSCGTNLGGAAVTTYATRYTPMPSVDEDIGATVNSIRQAWPDAKALDGEFQVASPSAEIPSRFAAIEFAIQGNQSASFAMVAHTNGWAFKLRATGLKEDANDLALISTSLFVQGLPEGPALP